jgi:EAL and modified HD-GYP domain-containing signal transduction protein
MVRSGTRIQAFAAAHPIFNRQLEVYAYDLDFHGGFGALCDAVVSSGEAADLSRIVNLPGLTGRAKACTVFPRRFVVMGLPVLFPPKTMILHLPDADVADGELIGACRQLADIGYEFAVPCPGAGSPGSEYLEFANIVEVDSASLPHCEQQEVCRLLRAQGIDVLAKHVETAKDLDAAVAGGYTYFEGNFFRRPAQETGKGIRYPKLSEFHYLQVLDQVSKPELALDELDVLVRQDVIMTLQLLRFINSAWFGLKTSVGSVRHALVLLGPAEVKKWAAMLALSDVGAEKPRELFRRCLIRARMAEEVAPLVGLKPRASELFLMGMFSLAHALTDTMLDRVLRGLPFSRDVKMALLHGTGEFAPIHRLVAAYEQGQWPVFLEAAASLELEERAVPALFISAREWADAALTAI